MEFKFKLFYHIKSTQKLALLLKEHQDTIKATETEAQNGLQAISCVSKSLAVGLKISKEIGGMIEIIAEE